MFKKVAIITGVAAGLSVALMAALWVLGVYQQLGLNHDGTVALVLCVVGTVVLTVGLSALQFYSSRTGHDHTIGDGKL